MNASDRFTGVLVELASRGGRPPCGEPGAHELWTSDNAEDRSIAADRCLDCPVMVECGRAADANDEQYHVWGGRDRTRQTKKNPTKGETDDHRERDAA